MGVPARVRDVYEQHRTVLEALEAVVRETLRPWCEARGYLFYGRLKEPESLAEKLESGRYEAWAAIDDLYAASVVVPTAAHEPRVLEFLASAFQQHDVKGRHTVQKAPDVFRFDATRFIGRLRDTPGLERPAGIEQVLFEVQIPTAFEYAWAVATHDLVYKANTVDWQRIRLAAQLKAAVEQIDMLINNFERSADSVPVSDHDDTTVRREIVETCQRLIAEGKIPEPLTPRSWRRFAESVYSLVRSYTSARQVHDAIRSLLAVLEARCGAEPPIPVSGSLFQLVVEVAYAENSHAIDNFVIVESEELLLHGVSAVPKPFHFGGTGEATEPEAP
jgi:ppGpp synthetase/RelA/SpoT-type nucleotidyltranferase